MRSFYFTLIFMMMLGANPLHAQLDTLAGKPADNNSINLIPKEEPKKKHWYDQLSLGGYTHVRYNRLLETNPKLKCDQCDKSWGEGGAISFRRARVKLSGDVHERVYVYIQLDMSSNLPAFSSGGMNLNYVQVRDLYFDLALDKKKEFRLRPGVSKIPYGTDVLQSSQNRVAIDRTDAINSGAPNERDMGLFFYWAPSKIRDRFKELQNATLKGTGDYGVFGFGVYNGQSLNKADANDNLHLGSRLTYPFKLKSGQFIEPSIYGYTGYFNIKDVKSPGVKGGTDFKDQRAGASVVLYPQPFGLTAEYTFGESPKFLKQDTSVAVRNVQGGYVQAMYRIKIKDQIFNPYTRAQYYKGGKKHETDARSYEVHELEMGIEWQPIKAFELTAAYVISKRTFEDSKNVNNTQQGNLLRLQLQFNY